MAVQKKRHLAKAFTWRIVAFIITIFLAYIFTGSIKTGLSIGLIDFIIKFFGYYLHERLWYKTKWGIKEDKIPVE